MTTAQGGHATTAANRTVYQFHRCMVSNIFMSGDVLPETRPLLSRMIHIPMTHMAPIPPQAGAAMDLRVKK